MLLRIVTIAIVFFWLGSIGWLCAVIWAPPESRMSEVDVREVLDVFFNWNDSTNMTLLEGGVRRGQLTIAGGSGTDSTTGEFANLLSLSAVFESHDDEQGANRVDLFAKAALDFSREYRLLRGQASARVPRQQLSAHFDFEGEKPAATKARVLIDNREIFRFQGGAESQGGLPLHLLPMSSMLGISNLNLSEIEWDLKARMGNFSFGGRDQRAYLLVLTVPDQDQSIRVFLSEVGEPLRVETDLGFEAVSEILVPIESYRTTPDRFDD